MKTETRISEIAYDVELKDHRTGEHLEDRIVLEKSWLDVLTKMGLSDNDLIRQAYEKRGYFVLKILTMKKVMLPIDLEQLYADQAEEKAPCTYPAKSTVQRA